MRGGGQSHLTSPSSASFCFVSSVRGVEARIHTPPDSSLMAVERPPMGSVPNSTKGLRGGQWISFARPESYYYSCLPRERPDILRDLEDCCESYVPLQTAAVLTSLMMISDILSPSAMRLLSVGGNDAAAHGLPHHLCMYIPARDRCREAGHDAKLAAIGRRKELQTRRGRVDKSPDTRRRTLVSASADDVGKHDDLHALPVIHDIPHIVYKASPCLAA